MRVIAVLGGSGAATPELAASLREAGIDGLELRLVGRDAAKLAKVAAAASGLAGPAIRVTEASSVAEGVSGAEIVVNQVRVGGLRARAFDESFPIEFGVPGEETLGAGGFANAMRTVPAVLEIVREVERETAGAWFVNLTNPAGIVHQAISRTTRLNAITVCDSPVTLAEQARGESAAARVDYIGLNHAGFVTGAYAGTYGVLVEALDRYGGPVTPEVARSLGLLPNPYLRYYFDPPAMLAMQRGKRPRAEELLELEGELLAAYASGSPLGSRPASLEKRGAAWYGKATVPVVAALLGKGPADLIVGLPNGDSIPWLPGSAVVELPTEIDERGPGVRRTADLPADAKALLQAHAAFETLTVEGILEHDDAKLLRALTSNPMVPGVTAAREILAHVRAHNPA